MHSNRARCLRRAFGGFPADSCHRLLGAAAVKRQTIRLVAYVCVLLTTLAACALSGTSATAADPSFGAGSQRSEEGYSDHRPWIRADVLAGAEQQQASFGPRGTAHKSAEVRERFIRLAVQSEFAALDEGRPMQATVRRLEKLLGPNHVQTEVLRLDQIERAVRDKQYEFFILDAGWYSRLETTDHLSAVASFFPMQAVDPLLAAGTAFVARADDESIQRIPDFVGKRIAANYADSFTGYQIGLREMYKQGVILETLDNRVIFYGSNPRMILRAVLDGNADVGMLTACDFEKFTGSDGFDPKAFKIVGTRTKPLLSCVRSTRLYPSFYFAGLADTGFGLRKLLATQLLTMDAQSDKTDWTVRVTNRPVHELLFDLKAGPYADLSAWRLSKFAREQTLTVSVFLIVSLLIVFYAGSLSVLVRRRTKMLDRALADRDRIEQLANASRDHIAKLERTGIVGQMSTMIAHELKQPLGAITNFANGLLRRIKRGNFDAHVAEEVLTEIVEQGTRASEIVNRVRAYAKHQTPELKMADMSVSIDRAIETFKRSRRSEAVIHRHMTPYLWADIDGWEIELAILNLLKNAADATESVPDPEIHVSVRPHERFWRVEVTDNGPKISQQEVDRFLLPLVTSKEGGLGLGISIVANIVERHHGRLTATANPTRGVTMAIDIPHAVMPEHSAM